MYFDGGSLTMKLPVASYWVSWRRRMKHTDLDKLIAFDAYYAQLRERRKTE